MQESISTWRQKPKAMSEWEVWLARKIFSLANGSVYLEIGSRGGGSFLEFGSAFPEGSTLVTVDKRCKDKEISGWLTETCRHLREIKYNVIEVTGDSHQRETIEEVRSQVDAVDILFLDGDHTKEGVQADIDNYAPMVRKGGIVSFHDCGVHNWNYDRAKPAAKKIMDDVHGVFMKFAMRHKRYLILQEFSGLGFVWI